MLPVCAPCTHAAHRTCHWMREREQASAWWGVNAPARARAPSRGTAPSAASRGQHGKVPRATRAHLSGNGGTSCCAWGGTAWQRGGCKCRRRGGWFGTVQTWQKHETAYFPVENRSWENSARYRYRNYVEVCRSWETMHHGFDMVVTFESNSHSSGVLEEKKERNVCPVG